MLDAAQMLAPMLIAASSGSGRPAPTWRPSPSTLNGNGITVSAKLFAAMSAAAPGWSEAGGARRRRWCRMRRAPPAGAGGGPPVLHPPLSAPLVAGEAGIDPAATSSSSPARRRTWSSGWSRVRSTISAPASPGASSPSGVAGPPGETSYDIWPGGRRRCSASPQPGRARHPRNPGGVGARPGRGLRLGRTARDRLEVARLLARSPMWEYRSSRLPIRSSAWCRKPRHPAARAARGRCLPPRRREPAAGGDGRRDARERRRWGQLDHEPSLAECAACFPRRPLPGCLLPRLKLPFFCSAQNVGATRAGRRTGSIERQRLATHLHAVLAGSVQRGRSRSAAASPTGTPIQGAGRGHGFLCFGAWASGTSRHDDQVRVSPAPATPRLCSEPRAPPSRGRRDRGRAGDHQGGARLHRADRCLAAGDRQGEGPLRQARHARRRGGQAGLVGRHARQPGARLATAAASTARTS